MTFDNENVVTMFTLEERGDGVARPLVDSSRAMLAHLATPEISLLFCFGSENPDSRYSFTLFRAHIHDAGQAVAITRKLIRQIVGGEVHAHVTHLRLWTSYRDGHQKMEVSLRHSNEATRVKRFFAEEHSLQLRPYHSIYGRVYTRSLQDNLLAPAQVNRREVCI